VWWRYKLSLMSQATQPHANPGSSLAQATVFTQRINHITGHLKSNPKDHSSRRGLLLLVGKRKRILKYYQRQEGEEAYAQLCEELQIRR
jgi:small subunit ribosomal protein S15